MKEPVNLYTSDWENPPYPIVVRQGSPWAGYEDAGWLLGLEKVDGNNLFHIDNFSHCSCYGTLESMGSVWSGTEEELKDIIVNNLDPHALPLRREAYKYDYDYDVWMRFRTQVADFMEWTI